MTKPDRQDLRDEIAATAERLRRLQDQLENGTCAEVGHDWRSLGGLPIGNYPGRIEKKTLGDFQRWVIRKSYNFVPFEAYDPNARGALSAVVERDFFASNDNAEAAAQNAA
ncbi:MAG: hypothetical protein AB7I34_19215 [Rhizobiaceae bacterium]